MSTVVLTICIAVVGFAAGRALGSGGAYVLLLAMVVAGPYVLGVPPRTERDWLAIKICLIWLIVSLLAVAGVRAFFLTLHPASGSIL